MDVIFLIGVIQAVFLAVLIFGKKKKSVADYVLATWMIFISLHLLFYYFTFIEFDLRHPHLLGISGFFPILQGPFMFVYVSILISEKGILKKSYLLHVLPFLLITIYILFDFYLLSGSEKLNYYNEIIKSPPVVYSIGMKLNVFLGPLYVIWSLLLLRKHKLNIADSFSYSEQINLIWLKYVLIGIGFVWATVLVVNIMANLFEIISTDLISQLIYISLTIAVFFLGYFGFKQSVIYTDIPLESARVAIKRHTESRQQKSQKMKVESFRNQTERYKQSGLKPTEAESHLIRLIEYMDKKKPYLDNKLTLKQLADSLEISSNHLSQIINEKLNKNFFDFINEYRVDEVKQSLSDKKYKNYTLLAIAYECGFNSKSSFNSIFKKNNGLTPSEFQKSITA